MRLSIILLLLPFLCFAQSDLVISKNSNLSAKTGQIWNGILSCDNQIGVYFIEKVMSGDINIVGDELASVSGCKAHIRIQTNGIHAINITGIDNVQNIVSGAILARGTYDFFFETTPSGYILRVPDAKVVVPNTNPVNSSDSILVRSSDNILLALSGRYDSMIESSLGKVNTFYQSSTSPIHSISQDTLQPTWNSTINAFHFGGTEAIRKDSATLWVPNLDSDYSIVTVYAQDTNYVSMNIAGFTMSVPTSLSRMVLKLKGNALLSRIGLLNHRATTNIEVDFASVGTVDTVKHIIAVSYNGTSRTFSAYFDGVLVEDNTSIDPSGETSNTEFFSIGRTVGSTGTYFEAGDVFKGYIFDSFLYSSNLSQASLLEKSDYLNSIHLIY